MQSITGHPEPSQPIQPRLRAMVEVVDGELRIYPIAETDEQAQKILDCLLAWKPQ